MNEQPSMKLIFKGYQGDFPDKLFCKLSRRRKCKNEQSAITLPCLPVFFAQYDLCPTWVQVRINFCSNWAEVEFGTSAQFGWKVYRLFIPNLGIILPIYYWALQIGKQCKPVQVYSFSWFPLWVNLRKLLVGEASPIPFERHLWCRLRIHSEYFYLLTSAQFA